MTHFYFARFSSDGTFDPAFPDTTDNIRAGIASSSRRTARSTSATPARDIVYKLDADGAPVAGLRAARRRTRAIDTIALQPNGKILIGGIFENAGGQPHHALARLNADGSLDTAFADLHFSFDAGDPNGYVYGIAAQADGRLVAIGNFTLADGAPRQYMARVATGDYATSALVVQPSGASVDVDLVSPRRRTRARAGADADAVERRRELHARSAR